MLIIKVSIEKINATDFNYFTEFEGYMLIWQRR